MWEIFRKLMEERGLTASEVARETGLNRQLFSDWKSGKSTPKGDKIAILARFFGIPMEQFYEEGKEKS